MSVTNRAVTVIAVVLTFCRLVASANPNGPPSARSVFADRVIRPPADRSGAQIQVGANVRISRARSRFMHGETRIAADPLDYRKLIACSITMSSQRPDWPGWHEWDVLYFSEDEGLTWTPRVDSLPASDPMCEYTSRGTALFIADRLKNLAWDNWASGDMDIFRSPDGGAVWNLTTRLPPLDSPIMTPPAGPSSKDAGLWVAGTYLILTKPLAGAYAFHSTNDGRSFLPLVTLQAPPHPISSSSLYSGGTATLSDGTNVYSIMNMRLNGIGGAPNEPGRANTSIEIVRARLGASVFSKPKAVLAAYIVSNAGAPWLDDRMMLAADQSRGPFRDRVYATWPDVRTGRAEILLSYSDDAGITWAIPRIINEDRAFGGGRFGPDDDQAMLAVNKDGVVGVAWYSRAESDDDLGWTVRFRASLDGGATWLPSVRVSSAANSFAVPRDWSNFIATWSTGSSLRFTVGFHASHPFTGGDYTSMAADAAGVFHPVWTDDRTGVSQMWTTQIRVSGSAHRRPLVRLGEVVLPADPAMPNAPFFRRAVEKSEVGGLLTDTSDATYDAQAQTFSMTVRLENVSSKTLRGPWTMHVVSVESGHGDASVANADNGRQGAGATWLFHAKGNVLKPLQRSQPRRLALRLLHERPFSVDEFWTPVGDPLLLAGIYYRIAHPK